MSRIKPIEARLARITQRSQSKPLERAGPDLPERVFARLGKTWGKDRGNSLTRTRTRGLTTLPVPAPWSAGTGAGTGESADRVPVHDSVYNLRTTSVLWYRTIYHTIYCNTFIQQYNILQYISSDQQYYILQYFGTTIQSIEILLIIQYIVVQPWFIPGIGK
jgi:hypothetical protein